jgi:hypothetical protein
MATTWSKIHKNGVKGAFSTQTEAAPSLTDDTEGIDVRNCESVIVHIEATVGNMNAGSKFNAYVFNRVTGVWNPAPDLDIIIPAAQRYFVSPGFFVSRAADRIAWVPNTVGQASAIYILGASR